MNKTVSIIKIVAVLSAFTLVLAYLYINAMNARTASFSSHRQIIIDAGHGIPDGGAIASDGTVESDINLDIAFYLFDYLKNAGFDCKMMRSDRNSIFENGKTIHAKKVSDIKKRVEIASASPDALIVSIHMNTFPSPDVHGAQIFYKSGSELSKDIAAEIQLAINLKYQNDNAKVSKPIPSNVYLFSHIRNDSVLAECGFLTNPDDLSKLKDTAFKESIAKTIAEVIIYKLSGNGR